MRHALAAVVLVAISVTCVAGAATPAVRLASVPPGLTALRPWTATLFVEGSSARPTFVARGTRVRSFATVRAGRGRWRARVTLPAGRWRLEARLGGRTHGLRSVTVSHRVPDRVARPWGLALHDGSLYVADRDANRVLRIALASRAVTVVGSAREPVAVDLDPAGAVHAVSGWDIVRLESGSSVRVAGNGTRGLGGNGGLATRAQLGGPGGFGFDAAGRLYISEYDDGVRVVAPDGTIGTLARDLGAPHDLAVAPDGTVFVVQSHRNRVARIARDGRVTVLGDVQQPIAIERAADGSVFVAGADGIVELRSGGGRRTVASGLGTISGLALAADGTLYASSFDRREVLKIAPNGRVTTFVR